MPDTCYFLFLSEIPPQFSCKPQQLGVSSIEGVFPILLPCLPSFHPSLHHLQSLVITKALSREDMQPNFGNIPGQEEEEDYYPRIVLSWAVGPVFPPNSPLLPKRKSPVDLMADQVPHLIFYSVYYVIRECGGATTAGGAAEHHWMRKKNGIINLGSARCGQQRTIYTSGTCPGVVVVRW